MQSDPTVISLRPGGGNRGSRIFAPRFDSSAAGVLRSSDLPVLRPLGGAGAALRLTIGDSRFESHECICYTSQQLLQLREAARITDDILKLKQEIEAELSPEDQTWGHRDVNLASQSQNRYFEPDSRDWRDRSEPSTSHIDQRSWDTLREHKESNTLNSGHQEISQFNKQGSQYASSTPTVGPTNLLKVPWSARRGNLSEKDRVLKTVKGILNKLTSEKFDVLKGQLRKDLRAEW